MASIVLGMLGLKRSGKDAFASRLVHEHDFTRIALADPMRDAVYALNPLVRVEGDEVGPLHDAGAYVAPGAVVRLQYLVDNAGWDAAKATREVRRVLQVFGTEAGRDVHGPTCWVDITEREINAIPGPVVITDVRFPEEVALAQRYGFTCRVIRPGIVNDSTHASENSVNDVPTNYVVDNDGTLEDLYVRADYVANDMLARRRAPAIPGQLSLPV